MRLAISKALLETMRELGYGAPVDLRCQYCQHERFVCMLDVAKARMVFACAKCENPIADVRLEVHE